MSACVYRLCLLTKKLAVLHSFLHRRHHFNEDPDSLPAYSGKWHLRPSKSKTVSDVFRRHSAKGPPEPKYLDGCSVEQE